MDTNSKSKKPWYKKWWIWAIIIVVLVGFGGGANKPQTPTNQSQEPVASAQKPEKTETKPKEEAKEALVPISTFAQDKDFEFRVNSLRCGEKSIGGEYLHVEARGQYCRLNISVKNVSNKPQGVFATSHQKVFDAQNREFEHDSTATLYASDNVRWYDRLNPGIETSGDLLFDVPVDADLAILEIQESTLSDGLKMSLK